MLHLHSDEVLLLQCTSSGASSTRGISLWHIPDATRHICGVYLVSASCRCTFAIRKVSGEIFRMNFPFIQQEFSRKFILRDGWNTARLADTLCKISWRTSRRSPFATMRFAIKYRMAEGALRCNKDIVAEGLAVWGSRVFRSTRYKWRRHSSTSCIMLYSMSL